MNQRHSLLSRLAGATCSLMLGSLVLAPAAHADVGAVIGGSTAAGDQASLQLDASISGAFTYKSEANAPEADAHFDRHLFCLNVTPPSSSILRLYPHYQLPVNSGSDDVWNFPDVVIGEFEYAGGNLRISAGNNQLRCLAAMPSTDAALSWNVSHGLFDSGMGDYSATARENANPPGTPPAGPHQNLKLSGKKLNANGMYVLRVELQPGQQDVATSEWRLIDGYNTATLLNSGAGGQNGPMGLAVSDVDWCRLDPALDFENLPLGMLPDCYGEEYEKTGPFVSEEMELTQAQSHMHFLVKRNLSSATVIGAKQGFAVLRVRGGVSGATDEAQDWYPNDSVWYSY